MINLSVSICPLCGGRLKYYDHVKRIVRTKNKEFHWIEIRRLKCFSCGAVHRELPEFIYPHKHYEAEVIRGVLDGLITSDTIGYEDYPCEKTMTRWKETRKLHLL